MEKPDGRTLRPEGWAGLLSHGWSGLLESLGRPQTKLEVGGEGVAGRACAQSIPGPSAFAAAFHRLIREQLLEGDFTVNMRLLQVMGVGGRPSHCHEAGTCQAPAHASHCDRLGRGSEA